MAKIIFPFLFVSFNTFCQLSIDTPSNYSQFKYDEKGVIYAAEKIKDGFISSNIILKENDDWSFSTFTNQVFIDAQIKSNEYETMIDNFYQNSKILMKKEFYFRSVGDVFMIVFSYTEDGNELVNTIFQFIKKNKLYTVTCSSLKIDFSESFNEYLAIVESIKFQ